MSAVTPPAAGPDPLLQLDAWRGLSALLVLVGHLAQVFWLPFVEAGSALVPFFSTLSRHAVLVFFLLSGYFIALSLRRNALANGQFDAGEFALARVARLYPPLVGALLLTAACVAAAGLLAGPGMAGGAAPAAAAPAPAPALAPLWTLQAGALEYAGALLFAGGLEGANPVLWSLNIEARLYLLAALAAWAVTRRRWLHPVPLAAAALAAWSLLRTPGFAVFGAVWLLGALVALAPPALARARRLLSWTALGVFALLLLGAPARLAVNEGPPLWVATNQLLAASAYAALLFDLRFPAWALRLPARSAALSYTLYLVHWPLLVLLLTVLHPAVQQRPAVAALGTALGAALALGVAWALARRLERPAWFAARWRQALGRTARGVEPRA